MLLDRLPELVVYNNGVFAQYSSHSSLRRRTVDTLRESFTVLEGYYNEPKRETKKHIDYVFVVPRYYYITKKFCNNNSAERFDHMKSEFKRIVHASVYKCAYTNVNALYFESNAQNCIVVCQQINHNGRMVCTC